jgi:hypothetical protein
VFSLSVLIGFGTLLLLKHQKQEPYFLKKEKLALVLVFQHQKRSFELILFEQQERSKRECLFFFIFFFKKKNKKNTSLK